MVCLFKWLRGLSDSVRLSAGHFGREGIVVCTGSTLPWLIIGKVGRVRGEHCAIGGQIRRGDAR